MNVEDPSSIPVAVLNRRGLNRGAAFTHVKVGKLPIVLARPNQAGVFQGEVYGGQLALRRQLKVWRVGIGNIPDVAAHGAVVWLLLELQD